MRILNKHDLTNEEFRDILKLFDKYNAAFMYLNIRKNMISTKFIINKFCSMIGKKEPYKKPLKCKSSFMKVNTIWKKYVFLTAGFDVIIPVHHYHWLNFNILINFLLC